MQEFFFMGGYGFFVWSCYAISALALLILFFISYRSMRRSEIKLNELNTKIESSEPNVDYDETKK